LELGERFVELCGNLFVYESEHGVFVDLLVAEEVA